MAKRVAAARLAVSLDVDGGDAPVGTLAWSREKRAAAFEYAAGFAERGLSISPFNLQHGPGVRIMPTTLFNGLFGVFADSLPDGWGRLLLDRKIRALGGDPGSFTPVDRLAFVGTRGMGALCYRPEQTIEATAAVDFDADGLAGSAAAILARTADDAVTSKDVEVLLGANGGSAGARPKVLALRDAASGAFTLDNGRTDGTDKEAWLVKFGTGDDPVAIGRIEHAVALTAKEAGIDMPETRTVVGGSGKAYFAVRRFDRDRGRRVHVHTLAGLLNADHRLPSIDYEGFLKATRILTGRAEAVAEAFRRAVFNVMVANRDDHAKNHAFMMDMRGGWGLTPAYDITPSDGPGGEHSMSVCGEGRRPGRTELMGLARTASIKATAADAIVDQVEAAVAAFATQAEQAGLDEATTARLARHFEATRERFRKAQKAPPSEKQSRR